MSAGVAAPGPLLRFARRAIDIHAHEAALLGWAWLYVLSVMSSYYVLRPIRDAMGVEGGVENLQWLFTGTLLAMIAVNPAYAALVRTMPRQRFIAVAYRFFIANILVFAVLMHMAGDTAMVWVGRAFFIWVSVFNLFVVSVFWALMVDIFDSEQGKRLFGFLAAGATVGAITGSSLTASLASGVDTTWLLVVSAALLQVAIVSARRLSGLGGIAAGAPRPALAATDAATPAAATLQAPAPPGWAPASASPGTGAAPEQAPIGGGILAGITHTLRSPYLLNISLYILLFTITSTFLYFQQAAIVRDYFPDRSSRTAFFASVDLVVNVLTLAVQLFVTSRFLKIFGVAVTAAILPAITMLGFAALAAAPTLAVLVAVQVLRRVGNFGLARPTRELFFTVVSREDKYKAKSLIDTVVYRAGDQLGSWSYAALGVLGAGPVGVAMAAIPLSIAWLANALWLGRRQRTLAGRTPR